MFVLTVIQVVSCSLNSRARPFTVVFSPKDQHIARHTKGSHSFIRQQVFARHREQDRHNTHPYDTYILAKETDINKFYISLQL